jgi:hypothetical protein
MASKDVQTVCSAQFFSAIQLMAKSKAKPAQFGDMATATGRGRETARVSLAKRRIIRNFKGIMAAGSTRCAS